LVLLIFFIIITPNLIQSALKVNLPYAKQTIPAKSDEIVKIVITKSGQFYLDAAEVKDLMELNIALQKVLATKKNVQIQADKNVEYGLVVRVLNLAQQNGAAKMELLTQHALE
jgi:biopolymer transport protein ExbD